MREINLSDTIQNKAAHTRANEAALLVPGRTNTSWPVCGQCLKECDACNIEDAGPHSCELRAYCHGQEDVVKVTWGNLGLVAQANDILEDPNVGWAIKRAIADTIFFPVENHFDFSSKR